MNERVSKRIFDSTAGQAGNGTPPLGQMRGTAPLQIPRIPVRVDTYIFSLIAAEKMAEDTTAMEKPAAGTTHGLAEASSRNLQPELIRQSKRQLSSSARNPRRLEKLGQACRAASG